MKNRLSLPKGAASLALSSLLAFLPAAAAAQAEPRQLPLEEELDAVLLPEPYLIDAPTAAVLDYGQMALRSRFTSGGGLLTYLSVGILQRFNLGASWNLDRVIGSGTTINVRAPTVQVRWRFFDGSRYLPAIAAGFDGQGYFYNDAADQYNEKGRGLYFVGSQEIGIPGLWFHPGINISDFDTSDVFGFFGLSLNVEDKIQILTEWDNVRSIKRSRLNAGLRVFVSPTFQIDFGVREMFGTGSFTDGTRHKNERIVQLQYTGSF